jgi:trigger factor
MQVSLEKPEQGLEHKITVSFPSEELDKAVDKRLNEMRRSIKMDGFRPGKVPLSVVKKRYGQQVRQELLGEQVQKAFYDAVEKEGVKVAGYPMFDDLKDEDGNIEFIARFESYPEIKLPEFGELDVEKVVAEVTDKDVDNMIKKLREQRAAWRPCNANKKAKPGDQVIASFVGRVDGEEFEGGKADDVPIILGSGRMIPGFEEQLEGIKKGETRTIKVTFPEDYHAESLAGKEAEFDVTAHSVQTKELPEIDEEFVKSLGIEEGTEEALRNEIKVNMEREVMRAVKQQNRTNAFNALEAEVEVELPKAMVQQEIEALMNRAVQELQQQGIKPEDVNLTADSFKEEAEKRVKLGLILGEAIKEGDIKATEEEVTNYLSEQASAYEDPSEVLKWYQQNPQALAEVQSVIVEDKVAQNVLDQAKTKEIKKTFEEVVNPAA